MNIDGKFPEFPLPLGMANLYVRADCYLAFQGGDDCWSVELKEGSNVMSRCLAALYSERLARGLIPSGIQDENGH